MAAARADLADGADGPGDPVPPPFRHALTALDGARPRPEIRLTSMPAPKRLAPFAHALEATVVVDDEELADGRFVLLYDPSGPESWRGTFRVVTLARAELEPEMAADPLLPEVTWSWLIGALEARSVTFGEPSGTVTHAGSHYFGGLVERAPKSELEIRASWTASAESARPPGPATAPASRAPTPRPENTTPDVAAHLAAWCELLSQCAGLPPESGDGDGGSTAGGFAAGDGRAAGRVVALPQRRGPQQL